MDDDYPRYYHNQNQGNYSANHNSHWNDWNGDNYYQRYPHQDKYIRNSHAQPPLPPMPRPPFASNHVRPPGFNQQHQQMHPRFYRNRYPNPNNHQYHNGNAHHLWKRNQNNKRVQPEFSESEPQLKTTKKRKKPLSQNVPTKKEWSPEDAELALNVEKEYNKKSKFALIIKFPDQELNRDIVSQFHPAIDNVHFQQPCTPRFCFVTLQENVKPDEVIKTLNKQQFGQGFLSVEYKKDREDDQTIHAEDIDPLTLYVGNLAQEITKEDMINMYPISKRIDIGFAKKMKFTRYAFVSFRVVPESIEAFKKTHNQQMYNKSLIVRFRRLHGTVGMPGEPKPQNPPKTREDHLHELEMRIENAKRSVNNSMPGKSSDLESPQRTEAFSDLPAHSSNEIINENADHEIKEFKYVKKERLSPSCAEDEVNYKCMASTSRLDFMNNFDKCSPIKTEMNVKTEKGDSNFARERAMESTVAIKKEPYFSEDDHSNSNCEGPEYTAHEIDDIFCSTMDFESLYERMVNHKNKLNTLKENGP